MGGGVAARAVAVGVDGGRPVAVQVVRVAGDRRRGARTGDLDQAAGVVVAVRGRVVVVVFAGLQVAVAVVGVGGEPCVGCGDGEDAAGGVVGVAGLVLVGVFRPVEVSDRVVVVGRDRRGQWPCAVRVGTGGGEQAASG